MIDYNEYSNWVEETNLKYQTSFFESQTDYLLYGFGFTITIILLVLTMISFIKLFFKGSR